MKRKVSLLEASLNVFVLLKAILQKLIKQHKETGDIHPRPQGGSPEPKLKGEQLIDLLEIIETNNDATLEELCDLLEAKSQVRVSLPTMGRITQKLNYSVKKNSLRRRKRK